MFFETVSDSECLFRLFSQREEWLCSIYEDGLIVAAMTKSNFIERTDIAQLERCGSTYYWQTVNFSN